MKKHLAILSLATLCCVGLVTLTTSRAAVEPVPAASFQYAIIQSANNPREPYVIRPDGKVEQFGGRLAREKAPDKTDERSYFMNSGHECAGQGGLRIRRHDGGVWDCDEKSRAALRAVLFLDNPSVSRDKFFKTRLLCGARILTSQDVGIVD